MQTVDVQKAVVEKNGKYLMLFRSKNARFFPEHWDFPGGRREEKESRKLGVEREVLEETGLTLKAMLLAGRFTYFIDPETDDAHQFTLFTMEGEIGEVTISDEHTDFGWFTPEEICTMKVEPYVLPYLESQGFVCQK